MSEVINKLQPDRTIYLNGFDGFGAAAALHHASPTGFEVTGVFRDQVKLPGLNHLFSDREYGRRHRVRPY
jgi:hypothetical protein